MYVIEDLERALLGREAAERLKLVTRLDNLSSADYKTKVVDKYSKLFKGLRVMKDNYSVTLKEDAKPFQMTVPRKAPLPLYQKTKEELDRMLETGVISRVDQPIEWCAPMVVTPKNKSQGMRGLKQAQRVRQEREPPTSSRVGRLVGSRVFTKLDANSGFWQIKLAWKSRPLTTFITPWGASVSMFYPLASVLVQRNSRKT